MDNDLFADLLVSLNEAVEYAKGNKTKGRSMRISMSDEEVGMNQIVLQQLGKLSVENKKKVIQYANELLQAST